MKASNTGLTQRLWGGNRVRGEQGKEGVRGSVLEKAVGEGCPCKDGVLSRELVLVSYAAV